MLTQKQNGEISKSGIFSLDRYIPNLDTLFAVIEVAEISPVCGLKG